MKKFIFCILFSLVSAFLFPLMVSADAIPGNSHSVDRCVKVVNLSEFPGVVLIGYYTGPMVDKYEAYQIKNNECLTKGYKFNSLSIYWATKEKFDLLDLKKLIPSAITLLLENIEPYGGYVDQSNPLMKEDIEYSIAGFSDQKLILYKSKQVSEYNNGDPKKIETFDNPLRIEEPSITPTPTSTPSPTPQKRGFWQAIICFFKELFGGSCQ